MCRRCCHSVTCITFSCVFYVTIEINVVMWLIECFHQCRDQRNVQKKINVSIRLISLVIATLNVKIVVLEKAVGVQIIDGCQYNCMLVEAICIFWGTKKFIMSPNINGINVTGAQCRWCPSYHNWFGVLFLNKPFSCANAQLQYKSRLSS